MFRLLHAIILGAALAAPLSHADAIRIAGKQYDDVLIDRSAATIFVRVPESGELFTIAAAEVAEEDIHISPTYAERMELRKRWTAAREPENAAEAPAADSIPTDERPRTDPLEPRRTPANPESEAAPPRSGPPEGFTSDGVVSSLNLRDVPLDKALSAILRPLNLDYRVVGNIVYVSTPDRLRTESVGDMETRVYDLKGMTDTLPKIVVRNTGGPGAVAAPPGAAQTNAGAVLP